MNRLKLAVEWFKCHKTAIGMTLASVAGIMAGAGTVYGSDDLLHHAAVLGLIATALGGGGMMKSDEFYRARKEALDTGVDRRATSGGTIPPVDLKKLAEKVAPPPTEKDS